MIFGAVYSYEKRPIFFFNKILLFEYPGEIFSAPERAVLLALKNNRHLIILFLSRYYLHRKSSLWSRYKTMNIETI